MRGKIIGIGVIIAIVATVIVFANVSQQERNPHVIISLNSTSQPEGKHLQLSLNESVGIKSVS